MLKNTKTLNKWEIRKLSNPLTPSVVGRSFFEQEKNDERLDIVNLHDACENMEVTCDCSKCLFKGGTYETQEKKVEVENSRYDYLDYMSRRKISEDNVDSKMRNKSNTMELYKQIKEIFTEDNNAFFQNQEQNQNQSKKRKKERKRMSIFKLNSTKRRKHLQQKRTLLN